MTETNRLNAVLIDMNTTGQLNQGLPESVGPSQPIPSAKQLLYAAAQRHQEQAEGMRTLARLLPDDDVIGYEARRTLRAAVENLVGRLDALVDNLVARR